jgi:hypothetical protein
LIHKARKINKPRKEQSDLEKDTTISLMSKEMESLKIVAQKSIDDNQDLMRKNFVIRQKYLALMKEHEILVTNIQARVDKETIGFKKEIKELKNELKIYRQFSESEIKIKDLLVQRHQKYSNLLK